MVFYFHYKSAATYNSVVPSQSAESILDSWIYGPLKLYPTYPPFFNWKQHSMWQQCTLRRNVYVEAVEGGNPYSAGSTLVSPLPIKQCPQCPGCWRYKLCCRQHG